MGWAASLGADAAREAVVKRGVGKVANDKEAHDVAQAEGGKHHQAVKPVQLR